MGIDRTPLCIGGVAVPGVEGGVNAGLTSMGGGGDWASTSLRSSSDTGLADEGRGG